MAAYSDNLHSEVSAEELSRKWGIGQNNSKANLYVTKQMNFRSSILPLTKIYQTDILSQKLRRFGVKLYTDNLFDYENYVQGNK